MEERNIFLWLGSVEYTAKIFLVTGSSVPGREMLFVRKGKECRQSGEYGGVSQPGNTTI